VLDSIFQKNYREYLEQISRIDFQEIADRLGARTCDDEIIIPFFGQAYRVSRRGILNPASKKPAYSICIVLCKYILLCPAYDPTQEEWVAFKDFKDAAPLVASFSNTTLDMIAGDFSDKIDKLENACKSFGGRPPETELSYDLLMKLYPLPKVPVLLLFNDADDEFPADCKLLFERRAEHYLDMECLAILGGILADYLRKAAFEPYESSENAADDIPQRT
jgi:hypothetical protein